MSYALFRLPDSETIFRNTLHDEPEELKSLSCSPHRATLKKWKCCAGNTCPNSSVHGTSCT